MDYDLFQTVLTEIEDTINTRLLTYVAEDDIEPLTPKQLVTGYRQQQRHPVDEEEREYADRVTLTKRERLRRTILAKWWEDFYAEYVLDLEKFHCPTVKHTKQIELGQVLTPGTDGKVRRVSLLIADRFRGVGSITVTRDPRCLYSLELHAGQIDDDHTHLGPFKENEAPLTELDESLTGGVSETPTSGAHSLPQGGRAPE
ncbi:hypothetical protein GHT06_019037 [Daphnia sinensis]|uniref:Uncharacterized protein n=1 Tax=Daphnia sinensis TaxID=1820382 RepID=A0AAD5L9V7_9CRUS|nr:hypothetical protein GHT06_019037 [Daphnia sinensis]